MTAFLFRLGRTAHAHPRRIIGIWLLLIVAFSSIGFGLGGKLADSFTIPGTESQQALDRLDAVFPQASGGSAQAVMVAPAGQRIDEGGARTAVLDTIKAIDQVPGVRTASSPYTEYATDAVSADHRAAIVSVQFTTADSEVKDATLEGLKKTGSIGRDAGLTVAFSGQAFQNTSFGASITELFGLLFAGVVLLVTFGSLRAAGMPLLTAVVGVVVALAAIIFTANFITVASASLTLALMLGLAVGIDYSLFVISRYREQLAIGKPSEEALPAAVATAGTAVVFAGTTVIIALCGLLIVGIPFLSVMGVGAAFGILVAVLAAISLLPAVLRLNGERMRPKPGSRTARRAVAMAEGRTTTLGARWVALVAKAPAVAALLAVAGLAVLAIPVASMQLSLPTNGQEAPGSQPRVAYDLITKNFGEGRNGPLVVLVDVTQNNDFITDLDRMKDRIAALPDVKAVGKPAPNATLDTAIIQVIPDSGPTSAKTVALVNRLRDLESTFDRDYDMPMSVTGTTAVQIDVSSQLGSALGPFVVVIVGLAMILLAAVFRSIVVPLKAAVGFLLSIGASVGATVAVFQWGWGADLLNVEPAPLLSFLPVLAVAILFGLSMDYEVFLVSGMRETWAHTGDHRLSVHKGFAQGARVVTAAALIMIFVFASFIPEGTGVIKPIAFTLACGILLDAFVVRMTLVPAVMLLFRRTAWYLPRWLDRLLPTIDIEGVGIVAHRDEVAWAAGERRWALSTADLVPPAPFTTEPLVVHAERGTTTVVEVPAEARRGVVAVLTGHLEPAEGHVQADGRVSPTGTRELRQVAAPVFDDGSAADASAHALVGERLRFAPRGRRSGSVNAWLAVLPAAIPSDRPIGTLPPEERLAVLALAALAGGASVLVVDAGESTPLDRLVGLLDLIADGDRAAVLVTSPPDGGTPSPFVSAARKKVSA